MVQLFKTEVKVWLYAYGQTKLPNMEFGQDWKLGLLSSSYYCIPMLAWMHDNVLLGIKMKGATKQLCGVFKSLNTLKYSFDVVKHKEIRVGTQFQHHVIILLIFSF